MKFRAWWHESMRGHAQRLTHVSVPRWARDEGVLVHCSCGEVFVW